MSISNCGKDENGRYIGGAAGDQTGKEWHVIPWYNRPWNCILRHPNAEVRKMIADMAKASANNNNIGYDQGQRLTYWEQLKNAGYKPENIKTKCEADCSSGVCSIVKAVGYRKNIKKLQDISITTTHYMRDMFKKAGFEVLTDSKYLTSDAYLLPGDILLNDKYHTATNLTKGSKAKVETTKPSTSASKKIYSGTFPTLPKNSKGSTVALMEGAKGSEVLKLQKFLNWAINSKLKLDSTFGPLTENAVKKFQKTCKITVDGKFGPVSLQYAKKFKK